MESSVSFGIGGTPCSFVANVARKPFWTSSQKIGSDCDVGSASWHLAANFRCPLRPHLMKQHELRARPKWHQRASPSEIDEVARIDRVIDDLRRQRGKIINRVNMRTHVWMIHHSRRKRA